MMIRSFVIVTAMCLLGTSASAELTMEECKAKYRAALASKTAGQTWSGFQEKQCGMAPNTKGAQPDGKEPAPKKH